MKLLEKDEETINMLENFRKEDDHSDCDVVAEERTILNPPTMEAKGKTNARLKSNLEKRKRKAKKGEHNQENNGDYQIFSPNFTAFTPSIHHLARGHSNVHFTTMLQDNNDMHYLNKVDEA
ncbi:Protein FAR1-RELATED SEQUENCE [Abeliophyllum distichum]|uniref:Protein FAR1-RELATED SEQUENCE n=1 Tax=Abeliophyllum distichum TaxID=126358 RepID=A0ABD1Q511_9LAMI